MNNLSKKIIDQTKEFISCDEVEIRRVGDTYFLFTGHKRTVKNRWQGWVNGEVYKPKNFNYVEKNPIASGRTLKELRDSLNFYIRLIKAPNNVEGMLLLLERDGVPKETLDNIRKHKLQSKH